MRKGVAPGFSALMLILAITILISVFTVTLPIIGGDKETEYIKVKLDVYGMSSALEGSEIYVKDAVDYSIYQGCYNTLSSLKSIGMKRETFISNLEGNIARTLKGYVEDNYIFLAKEIVLPGVDSVKVNPEKGALEVTFQGNAFTTRELLEKREGNLLKKEETVKKEALRIEKILPKEYENKALAECIQVFDSANYNALYLFEENSRNVITLILNQEEWPKEGMVEKDLDFGYQTGELDDIVFEAVTGKSIAAAEEEIKKEAIEEASFENDRLGIKLDENSAVVKITGICSAVKRTKLEISCTSFIYEVTIPYTIPFEGSGEYPVDTGNGIGFSKFRANAGGSLIVRIPATNSIS